MPGTVLAVLQVLLIARVAGRHYYLYLTENEAQGDSDGVQSIAQKQRAEI